MKYLIILCVVISLIISSISCLSYQKRQPDKDAFHKEYIVQFEKDVEKKTIETVFERHTITSFSYLTSSRKRGYILLIRLKKSIESTLEQLRGEKGVKNIDPNYKRDLNQSQ